VSASTGSGVLAAAWLTIFTVGTWAAAALLVALALWRGRGAVAVAILLVPVLLWAPSTLDRDHFLYDHNRKLGPSRAAVDLPAGKERDARNLPLVRAAARAIPAGDEYQWVTGGPYRHLGPSRWHQAYVLATDWAQYYLAPRVAVDSSGAPWALVLGAAPAQVGVHPRHAWRFGEDWLVQR
jgi:hypothetical protein